MEITTPQIEQDGGTWYMLKGGNRFGSFETEEAALDAARTDAIRGLSGPLGRDEYEAAADALNVGLLSDGEIEDRSYSVKYHDAPSDDLLLARLRLEGIEEEQKAERPDPAEFFSDSDTSDECPSCGGPTSIAGERCDGCRR